MLKLKTIGECCDEVFMAEKLDGILAKHPETFRVYKEVSGRHLDTGSGVRIDRILWPGAELRKMWPHGPIGVEIKGGDTKLGKVVCQCLDYSRSLFNVPGVAEIRLQWIFIWQCDNPHGDIESIMVQNRIGTVTTNQWHDLLFQASCTYAIDIPPTGPAKAVELRFGRKVGSR